MTSFLVQMFCNGTEALCDFPWSSLSLIQCYVLLLDLIVIVFGLDDPFHSEMTLCGCWDVKIQELDDSLCSSHFTCLILFCAEVQ